MDEKDFRRTVADEYRRAEAAGHTHPISERMDVGLATNRVIAQIALGTLPEDLFTQLKDDTQSRRDAYRNEYRDKVYYVEEVARLSPEQLAQTISYFATMRIALPDGRQFVRLYDEEAGGFRVAAIGTSLNEIMASTASQG